MVGLDLALFHDPVVNVVVQDSISSLEMQVLEGCRVVHQVQTVVHVVSLLLGQDQGVLDQFLIGDGGAEVEEGIAGLSQARDTFSMLCLGLFITCEGKA